MLRNWGCPDARKSSVYVFIDDSESPDQTIGIPGILSGEFFTTISSSWTAREGSHVFFKVGADVANEISETDESNNKVTARSVTMPEEEERE